MLRPTIWCYTTDPDVRWDFCVEPDSAYILTCVGILNMYFETFAVNRIVMKQKTMMRGWWPLPYKITSLIVLDVGKHFWKCFLNK